LSDVGRIFTPAQPADERVFAKRTNEQLQERAAAALTEPGYQLVLYGPTGVGKTSLVRFLCRQLSLRTVDVNAGPDFDRMLGDALAELDPDARVGHELKLEDTDDFAAGPRVLHAKLGSSEATTTRHERRARSLTKQLIDAMEQSSTSVLFIDNFELLDQQPHRNETVARVAELLKAFSDRSAQSESAPTVVIAGISSAAEELIALDDSVRRRVLQVKVPRMTSEELGVIVDRGAEELGVEFDVDARTSIIDWSDGFPYYTHLLAKHSVAAASERPESRIGVIRRRSRVTTEDFKIGLRRAVHNDLLALQAHFRDAVAERESRRAALRAVAACTVSEPTFKEIKQAARGGSDPKQETRILRTALNALVDREPRILVRRDRLSDRQGLYRFRDPLMRAYVRIDQGFEDLLQSDTPPA